MTEEIIIDGELSCNNCLEKTRCKQQQEVKAQRIDAILSYIANEDNEKYIVELKNEIPAITRCDVVLEKQLKRLEQENAELKEKISKNKAEEIGKETYLELKIKKYKRILEEIRAVVERTDFCHSPSVANLISVIRHEINEVLKKQQ